MWFFYVAAILIYMWPGHLSAGAAAFEEVSGIPWQVSACVALIFVGVLFSMLSVIYNFLEKLLGLLIGLLVVGTSVIAAIVGDWDDLANTVTGMFAFGYFPDKALSEAWFPIVVGSIAFAGPSGMQQMWYTLQLRDSGAGMGAHIPKVRGLRTEGEAESMPSRGFMFDTEDPAEMAEVEGLAQVGHLRRAAALLGHHHAGHGLVHGAGHVGGPDEPGRGGPDRGR